MSIQNRIRLIYKICTFFPSVFVDILTIAEYQIRAYSLVGIYVPAIINVLYCNYLVVIILAE